MALTKVSYSMITGAPANVLDYGADPTGITSSSTAIQNAVNASSAVYFPPGTYLISTAITLNSNNTLFGNGKLKRSDAGYLLTATAGSDIAISGLQFEGLKQNYAIHVTAFDGVSITNCECFEIGLLFTDNSTATYAGATANNSVKNIVVANNRGTCTTTPSSSSQFIRLLYGIDFAITGNEATGYYDGLLMWGGDANGDGASANQRKCYNGSVSGNTFNVLSAGIWTGMAQNVTVSGNTVTSTAAAAAEGLDAEGSINITFDGNIVSGFGIAFGLFFLNRDITFSNNQATVRSGGLALYNNNTSYTGDYANIGLVCLTGNTIRAYPGETADLNWGAIGELVCTNNYFKDCIGRSLTSSRTFIDGNTFVFEYTPTPTECFRLAALVNGIGITANAFPSNTFTNNQLKWVGSGVLAKRGLLLGSADSVASSFMVSDNRFERIQSATTFYGTTTTYAGVMKQNTFGDLVAYPFDCAGATTYFTMLWVDNFNAAGQDAIGSTANITAQDNVWYLSLGSRIWNNAPTSGGAPGWVCTTAGKTPTFKAMANLA